MNKHVDFFLEGIAKKHEQEGLHVIKSTLNVCASFPSGVSISVSLHSASVTLFFHDKIFFCQETVLPKPVEQMTVCDWGMLICEAEAEYVMDAAFP